MKTILLPQNVVVSKEDWGSFKSGIEQFIFAGSSLNKANSYKAKWKQRWVVDQQGLLSRSGAKPSPQHCRAMLWTQDRGTPGKKILQSAPQKHVGAKSHLKPTEVNSQWGAWPGGRSVYVSEGLAFQVLFSFFPLGVLNHLRQSWVFKRSASQCQKWSRIYGDLQFSEMTVRGQGHILGHFK